MYDLSVTMADVMQRTSKHRYNLKTRFEIVRSLGSGTYGKVKLALDKKTGQKVRTIFLFWAYGEDGETLFHFLDVTDWWKVPGLVSSAESIILGYTG